MEKIRVLYIIGPSPGLLRYGLMLVEKIEEFVETFLLVPAQLVKEQNFSTYLDDIKSFNINIFSSVNIFRKVLSYCKILYRIKEIDPHIIHFTAGSNIIKFLPISILFRSRIIFSTEHEPSNRHVGAKRKISKNLSFFLQHFFIDHYIVHGESSKRNLLMRGVPCARISIIPHGNFSYLRKYVKKKFEKENMVLFLGTLRQDKGVDFLKDIYTRLEAKLDRKEFKFIIAGHKDFLSRMRNDHYRTRLEEILEYFKALDNAVVYDYFINDAKFAELLARAKCVILPYISAAQSGILAAALSFKVAVVAFNVGDLKEIIIDGKNGFLINNQDLKMFTDKIYDLLNDEVLFNYISKNALNTANTQLNWRDIAMKTYDDYCKALV